MCIRKMQNFTPDLVKLTAESGRWRPYSAGRVNNNKTFCGVLWGRKLQRQRLAMKSD